MGITGLWPLLAPAKKPVSLSALCANRLVTKAQAGDAGHPQCPLSERPPGYYGLRIAVDASVWLMQLKEKRVPVPGGYSGVLQTFFFRLCKLLKLGILPVFVFDNQKRRGPNKKTRLPRGTWEEARDLRQMVEQFGFPCLEAVTEAEAECARLNAQDIVNAVLSSDADTFLFGGKCVIQNWSGSLTPVQRKRKAGLPAEGEEDNMPEPLNPKTPMEYVDVYQIDDIQKSVGWDRNALLFIAALIGNDFSEGLSGIGRTTAGNLAKSAYPTLFITAAICKDLIGLTHLKTLLTQECQHNTSKLLSQRRITANFDDLSFESVETFLNPEILRPAERAHIIHVFAKWNEKEMDVDVEGLWEFVKDKMRWRGEDGRVRFERHLLPGLRLRELRKLAHGMVRADEAEEAKDSSTLPMPSAAPPPTLKEFFPVRKSHLPGRLEVSSSQKSSTSVELEHPVGEEQYVEKVKGQRVHLNVAEVKVVWGPAMQALKNVFADLPLDSPEDVETRMQEDDLSFSSQPPPPPSQPYTQSQLEEEWEFESSPPGPSSQPLTQPPTLSQTQPSGTKPISTNLDVEWVERALIKVVAPEQLEVFEATEAWRVDEEARRAVKGKGKKKRGVEEGQLSIKQFFGGGNSAGGGRCEGWVE